MAVWHGERVLLIRNSYRKVFSFPSGRRGRQEDPALAAVRELREEVGLSVTPDALAFVEEIVMETSLVTDHVHLFELHLDVEPVLALDEREVVWAAFEPPEQARARALLPVVRRYLTTQR